MTQRHLPPVATGEDWLSPKDAGAHLKVSVDTIYDGCKRGGLRHAKLGHSTIRIRRAWLDEWAESFVTTHSAK